MQVIEINGTDYKCIEVWEDMTVSKAAEIQTILHDIPSLLKEIYDQNVSKDDDKEEKLKEIYGKIELDDRIKHFPLFYGKIIEALSDIPPDVMDRLMWDVRTQFYKSYCYQIVIGLLYGSYGEIKHIKSFKWKRSLDKPLLIQEYILPTTDHILGNPIPMANETTMAFTEVADLEIYSEKLKGGKYEVTPTIIAILCRPKGEAYNEKTILARAEIFKDLTMDIVWEVFFCILQLTTISSQSILISRLKKDIDKLKRSKRQGWRRSVGMVAFWRSLKPGYSSGASKVKIR